MLENNIKFASFADIFASFLVVLMILLLVVAVSPDEYPQPNATTALLGKSSLSLFALFFVLLDYTHALCDDPCDDFTDKNS